MQRIQQWIYFVIFDYRDDGRAHTRPGVTSEMRVARLRTTSLHFLKVGKGTVLELNSSQVSLTQAQLTYNQSIYDYLVAKADLDQVLGKE